MATEVATLLFEADTRPLRSANDEIAKTERAGVKAENAARKMGTELKKAANDSINPIQKVSNGVSALASALIALGAALAVRQFIAYTDQWTDLNSRLINATGSAEAANQALQAISQTASTTYSSLQQTAEAFLLNSMALNELGYTTRQQVELADALNNALVISGTKGERAASVMNALSKAMALGKLSGENFNTVVQSGGRVVQALADGLGVTTSQLRALSTEGLITTEAIITAMTTQLKILRTEAEEMPATIGDAMVQFGNFALEAVGKLDEAAGLSASISAFIIDGMAGLRAQYMPNEQQQFNLLLAQRVELEEELSQISGRRIPQRQREMQNRIDDINAEMHALSNANVERQKADSLAAAQGIVLRQELEAKRIADHQAELNRIKAEQEAKAEAGRVASINVSAQRIAEGLMVEEDKIKLSYETQRQIILESTRMTADKKLELMKQLTQRENNELDAIFEERNNKEQKAALDRFEEIVKYNRKISDLEKETNNKRTEASAQQTQQLLEFDNVLLRNKSQTTQAAYKLSINLMNEEKREAAKKIITDSYAAAMSAWKSLAGIPIIGPALGAAAAGGIIAAGVSYSAKSLAGRALGGQVLGGQSYVVGERGPEVLTMGSTGGKIIPNSAINKTAAQQSGGDRTANVSFNITANDASGFDKMLNSSRGKIIDIINMALNDNGREAIV